MKKKEWFATWFDTKYYHILYQNRDENEAQLFIKNLSSFIELKNESKVLDLACGKGRHSIVLNSSGYDVTGYDLSSESIQFANANATKTLRFRVHDMRTPFADGDFDAVFNLFTSFGYFDDVQENNDVLSNINQSLKPGGYLIIDFMNVRKVIENIISSEQKQIAGIEFNINRTYSETHVTKSITVDDQGDKFEYMEHVQAFTLPQFEEMMSSNDFELIRTFGDFNLEPFDEMNSNRLILVARKKQ